MCTINTTRLEKSLQEKTNTKDPVTRDESTCTDARQHQDEDEGEPKTRVCQGDQNMPWGSRARATARKGASMGYDARKYSGVQVKYCSGTHRERAQ